MSFTDKLSVLWEIKKNPANHSPPSLNSEKKVVKLKQVRQQINYQTQKNLLKRILGLA